MMQSLSVSIVDAPLAANTATRSLAGAGAVVVFDGVVRSLEGARSITGLRYETYDPMAQHVLTALAQEALDKFGLMEIHVEHSRGLVAAGECSFRLRIASPHRREALDAMDWFIDRMKQDAPIWKTPEFSTDGDAPPPANPVQPEPEAKVPS